MRRIFPSGRPFLGPYNSPALVFLLALAVRSVYLWQLRHSPLSLLGSTDTEIYLSQAEQIARGHWLGNEVFFQSGFLYPYFLALFRLLFGPTLLPVYVAQVVIDSISAVLLCLLAKRFFGARAGLAAGLAYGLYGPFIAGSCQLLLDLPILFPLLAGLLLYSHAKERCNPGLTLIAGILLGLALVSRPYLIPLLAVPVVSALKRVDNTGLTGRLRLPLIALLGMLLMLMTVTVRNRIVGNEWVFTNAGGGFVFYLGNNPEAEGGFYLPDGLGIDDNPFRYAASTLTVPSRELGHDVTWSEGSSFWFNKGLSYWREAPGAAMRLLLKKGALCFNNHEMGDNYDYNYLKFKMPLLHFPWLCFGVVAPFGVLGMVLHRRRLFELLMLYSLVFLVAASQVLILVYTRHRYVLAAMLIFFGSSAVVSLVEWWRERRFRKVLFSVIALSLLALFMFRSAGVADVRFRSALTLANGLWNVGRQEDAYRAYDEMLRLNPNFSDGARDYAISLASVGEKAKAIEILTAMIDRTSVFPQGHRLLKELYQSKAPEGSGGKKAFGSGARNTEDDAVNLAQGYFRQRRFLEAKEVLVPTLQRFKDSGRLVGLLAYAEDHLGNFREAVELYQKAHALVPGDSALAGRQEVASGFLSLMGKDLSGAKAAFTRAVSSAPESAEAYYGLGVVLRKEGKSSEAAAAFQKCISCAKTQDRWVERAKEDLEKIVNVDN